MKNQKLFDYLKSSPATKRYFDRDRVAHTDTLNINDTDNIEVLLDSIVTYLEFIEK